MPFTAGVSAERRLNKHFSLEAGLQYNRLDGDHTIHTLAVPVKLNAVLASNSKVDFYATLGGAAEKCIAELKTMVLEQSLYNFPLQQAWESVIS